MHREFSFDFRSVHMMRNYGEVFFMLFFFTFPVAFTFLFCCRCFHPTPNGCGAECYQRHKKGRYKINPAQGDLVGFTANSIVSLPIRSPCFTIRSDWFMRRVSSSIFIALVEYGKTGIWMQLMSVMKFPVLASVENNIELVRDYCMPGVGGFGLLF